MLQELILLGLLLGEILLLLISEFIWSISYLINLVQICYVIFVEINWLFRVETLNLLEHELILLVLLVLLVLRFFGSYVVFEKVVFEVSFVLNLPRH